MPFDEDEDSSLPTPQKGVKFKGKSMFDNLPKKPSPAALKEKANQANQQQTVYTEQGAELAMAFRKLLDDKKLSNNKTDTDFSIEKEILGKLVDLGISINIDENEQEGMGSIALITLLLKCILLQRDKINELEFNLFSFKKTFDNKKVNE